MDFRTIVDIDDPGFRIIPCEEMLFVGSCFADSIGSRFKEEKFRAVVNPYGVMYNPASILHTIERMELSPSLRTTFITLGTNHVYRLKETGEIVDNCQKRPQSMFTEEELSVDECADYLMQAISILRDINPEMNIVLTVSPIRYRKYGYHDSQLSKATLLLAINKVLDNSGISYFPAYEILNDELRDYRFYKPDMLHPSEQAADYIYEHFKDACFSRRTMEYINEWRPIRQALSHRPLNPDAQEYVDFMENTRRRVAEFNAKWKL